MEGLEGQGARWKVEGLKGESAGRWKVEGGRWKVEGGRWEKFDSWVMCSTRAWRLSQNKSTDSIRYVDFTFDSI